MPSAATQTLRIVNVELCAGLIRLQADPNAPSLLKPEDLSALLAVISHAARCRSSLVPNGVPDAELDKELREYRDNLEKLAKVLLSVQGRLLAEKARLQIAQSHVAATNAWALASKDTL